MNALRKTKLKTGLKEDLGKVHKHGFTLVELVVVVVILGILSTIAFVSYTGYTKDAKDAVIKSDFTHLQRSLDMYYAREGKFPPETGSGTFGAESIAAMPEIVSVPTSPLGQGEYSYEVSADGKSYTLTTKLSDASDYTIQGSAMGTTVSSSGSSGTEETACEHDYILTDGHCLSDPNIPGEMILVYDGLVENDLVDLPFHGNVAITNVDWGVGGEHCPTTFSGTNLSVLRLDNRLMCRYGPTVSTGETTITVIGKATGFGNHVAMTPWERPLTTAIAKLTKVTSWKHMGFTSLNRAFERATTLVEIPNYGTAEVTDMSWMFSGASSFNQPLTGFDTSRVTNMIWMFNQASSFNQDLSYFITDSVNNMSIMFCNTQVTTVPSTWNLDLLEHPADGILACPH